MLYIYDIYINLKIQKKIMYIIVIYTYYKKSFLKYYELSCSKSLSFTPVKFAFSK